MEADGIELEDLSIREDGIEIGDPSDTNYTKFGQGSIDRGKFSMTIDDEGMGDMNGIGEMRIGGDEDGLEMDFESIQFLEEGEPVVELNKSTLTFTGPEGDTTLSSGDLIMFDEDNPVLEVSRNGIDISNPDAAIRMIDENYAQCGIAIRQIELDMGMSSFSLIDPPTLIEEDDEMVNKIVKITNIDSIEFNRNTSNKFNRLCTSADVNSTTYSYSDEHVISYLAVKTLLDKRGVEITG
jgi:hypothetical protein